MSDNRYYRVALYIGSKNKRKFEDLKQKSQNLYYEKHKIYPTTCNLVIFALENLIKTLTDLTEDTH